MPVFNGGKYGYISGAKHFTIPSLRVPLSMEMEDGVIRGVLETVNRYYLLMKTML